MDFQHRIGAKTGGGGVASTSETNKDRRERLRLLALESIDLAKDPYFMKNHLGTFECKLCLTLHANEGSYLAHTQGKKHQQNLARRAAKDVGDNILLPALVQLLFLIYQNKARLATRKFIKIGRPGYKGFFTKIIYLIDYPEVNETAAPRYRLMAAFEQHQEQADRNWQYLLFAIEPYETIAFKIPSREVDKSLDKFWTYWNTNTKQYFLQLHFKNAAAISAQTHPAVGLAPATVPKSKS
ncbi:hypothetical protein HZS_801 [Henneguya salminicola]|nr:hypothetical protein HZS_801 [Henneguya salminicola]